MKKYILTLVFPAFIAGTISTANAQEGEKDEVLNWYNNQEVGMATNKALELLKDKEADSVIVAVIDSGIDVDHENLAGKIWVNTGEIPGNGIDDDGNGYVDDIHGWNFLGNTEGENQDHARLESTRIYAALRENFEEYEEDSTFNPETLSEEEKASYELYLEVKEEVIGSRSQYKNIIAQLEQSSLMEPMMKNMVIATLEIEGEEFTEEDLDEFEPQTPEQEEMIMVGRLILKGEFEEFMAEQAEAIRPRYEYHYNPDYDDRSLIGDDPMDMSDLDYGNNDYQGPDAMHGTHVGGIIGAVRGNDLGNDGVSPNAVLMSLRAVPDGDEFDKDIALAIRYAVDNGAKIINASFGKAYSVMPEEVYKALRYAEENDVLFVHAAGNSGQNLHEFPNYPANMFPFQEEEFTNYLSVGASTRNHDERLAASFSNYGKTRVDVFAPGFEIYSTVPDDKYENTQGTSMAAPMVSGVAAIIKGYFPELTMAEVREVIMESVTDFSETMQTKPGSDELVPFGELSKTGGVVNVVNAIQVAEEKVNEKK